MREWEKVRDGCGRREGEGKRKLQEHVEGRPKPGVKNKERSIRKGRAKGRRGKREREEEIFNVYIPFRSMPITTTLPPTTGFLFQTPFPLHLHLPPTPPPFCSSRLPLTLPSPFTKLWRVHGRGFFKSFLCSRCTGEAWRRQLIGSHNASHLNDPRPLYGVIVGVSLAGLVRECLALVLLAWVGGERELASQVTE